MDELIKAIIEYELDVPFKEFAPGQIIQSKQFNDDMKDIQDKINEVITKYNIVVSDYINHINNHENPHQVTAHQTGSYTIQEVDAYVDDLKAGNFDDGAIINRVLANNCIDTRNVVDGSITATKVENNFGSQLDISQNIDISNRYTKVETDEIIKLKVGDGTYSQDEIDEKLSQIQAGQIVTNSIGVEQLKSNVGELIDITQNKSILDQYTNEEINSLIAQGALPRDWGNITDNDVYKDNIAISSLPVVDVMTCDLAKVPISRVLDIDTKEVIDARGLCSSLAERLELINLGIDASVDYPSFFKRLDLLELTVDSIIQMFSEVINNE